MITVWSAKEGSPLYVLQAHAGPITQMLWMEEKQQLISCSKDKRIKVWQLPQVWMDEEDIITEVKKREAEERKKMVVVSHPIVIDQQKPESLEEEVGLFEQKEVVHVPKANQKVEEDEDDDLTGWNK